MAVASAPQNAPLCTVCVSSSHDLRWVGVMWHFYVWWNWRSASLIAPRGDTGVIMKPPTSHINQRQVREVNTLVVNQGEMGHVAVSEEQRGRHVLCKCFSAQPVNVTDDVFIRVALIRFHIPGARLDNVPAALPRSLVPERVVWKWFSQQPACVRSLRSGDWHFYDSAHPRQRQRGPRDSSAHNAYHHMQVNVPMPVCGIVFVTCLVWTYVLSALSLCSCAI